MIPELSSSLLGRALWSEALSGSVLGYRSEDFSGPGVGAITVLTGEATPYSSTMRDGGVPGSTEEHTFIHTRTFTDLPRPNACRTGMSSTSDPSESGRMRNMDAELPRSMDADIKTSIETAAMTGI